MALTEQVDLHQPSYTGPERRVHERRAPPDASESSWRIMNMLLGTGDTRNGLGRRASDRAYLYEGFVQ